MSAKIQAILGVIVLYILFVWLFGVMDGTKGFIGVSMFAFFVASVARYMHEND